MNTKSGSPAQKFLARHKEFLRHWADGLHALEIAQRMGLSPAQLAKHSLKAFEEEAPRKIPGYDCIFWDDFPRACLQTSYRSQISEAARHTKAAKTSASLS